MPTGVLGSERATATTPSLATLMMHLAYDIKCVTHGRISETIRGLVLTGRMLLIGIPPSESVEDKAPLVLPVLPREVSIALDARRKGASAMSISTWHDLISADAQRALGEAHWELRSRKGVARCTHLNVSKRNGLRPA